ncbi:hypothetical protein ES703_122480 [subsurface metagenome]
MRKTIIFYLVSFLLLLGSVSLFSQTNDIPSVLSIRERAAVINKITKMRLDILLPKVMEETGYDMWLIACNEDNLDPVFQTMIPYDVWCPSPPSPWEEGYPAASW